MKKIKADVVIIGGGATGAGTLRDCVLRGYSAILVERNDIASGTTGRNHGLLHSGARYAVNDLESAIECINENKILKKIAAHCVEDTGGLFVTLPEDDEKFHNDLLIGCQKAGIECNEISVKQALFLEPNLNNKIIRAASVPDGTIDPFRLTSSNILDAIERGGKIYTYTEVLSLILDKDRVVGIKCFDKQNNDNVEIYGDIIVNASGIWGQKICETANIEFKMFPSKGSMVIIDYRINNVVINRCRKSADGDIFVPGDTVSLIGTTSIKLNYDEIENLVVTDDEIKVLLEDGEKLIPNVSKTRVLRAYCGVRPLVAATNQNKGRNISRGIVCVDHEEHDGVKGLISIAGGKLITYRLMAEKTVDLISKKFNHKKVCLTHKIPLPGSEEIESKESSLKYYKNISRSIIEATQFRHGKRINHILNKDQKSYSLICECEMVTIGEIEYALKELNVNNLIDLRRRTRVGMGPCQGELCSYRAAGLFAEYKKKDGDCIVKMLIEFLEERFKGIKPVLWGDTLRETEFTYWIYQGLFGLGNL